MAALVNHSYSQLAKILRICYFNAWTLDCVAASCPGMTPECENMSAESLAIPGATPASRACVDAGRTAAANKNFW